MRQHCLAPVPCRRARMPLTAVALVALLHSSTPRDPCGPCDPCSSGWKSVPCGLWAGGWTWFCHCDCAILLMGPSWTAAVAAGVRFGLMPLTAVQPPSDQMKWPQLPSPHSLCTGQYRFTGGSCVTHGRYCRRTAKLKDRVCRERHRIHGCEPHSRRSCMNATSAGDAACMSSGNGRGSSMHVPAESSEFPTVECAAPCMNHPFQPAPTKVRVRGGIMR